MQSFETSTDAPESNKCREPFMMRKVIGLVGPFSFGLNRPTTISLVNTETQPVYRILLIHQSWSDMNERGS